MAEKNVSGIVDYCIFAGVLIISSCIGLYFSYKGNKSPEEFLMGNRVLKTVPVAMSLLTSYVSATILLGYSGEVYANGMHICALVLGGPLCNIFASYFVLPVLYPLKLTSINEYIELRFKSKRLRIAIFIPTFAKVLIISGIALYAPTLVLASFTNLDTLTNILLLGVICTIYSSLGGIRAVIWTDVFQLIIMMIGLVTLLLITIGLNGGFIETLYTASKGRRLEAFDMRFNPFIPYTFVYTFVYGIFSDLRLYITEQPSFQRICGVKNIHEARSVLKFAIFSKIIVNFIAFSLGFVAYASYAGCDPMALGIIKKKDQILPYLVIDKLKYIPGLPGLFTATIIGGSLSTVSSMMNSSVALIWRDIFLKFTFFKATSPAYATLTNKIISLAVGAVIIGIAIEASDSNGLIDSFISVVATLTGPTLGVFLIGYFLPKCNLKGVWTGFIVSSVFMLWLAIGRLFYKPPFKTLPFSADECDHSNYTSTNSSRVEEFISSTNNITKEINTDTFSIVSLYRISFTLNGIIGPLLCISLAVVVSYMTGNQKIEEISPELISPFMRKFYWTKEELVNFKEIEIEQEKFKTNVKNNLENRSPKYESDNNG